eukprot:scaffold1899_cov182-Alexandrium_tamarense.AAC.3
MVSARDEQVADRRQHQSSTDGSPTVLKPPQLTRRQKLWKHKHSSRLYPSLHLIGRQQRVLLLRRANTNVCVDRTLPAVIADVVDVRGGRVGRGCKCKRRVD